MISYKNLAGWILAAPYLKIDCGEAFGSVGAYLALIAANRAQIAVIMARYLIQK
jgi:hypothetical protein